MRAPPIRYYQTGSFAVGNRLLDPDQRSVQAGGPEPGNVRVGVMEIPEVI
jgi:pyruvate ferredoxin oxidoreductase beta subunit